MDVNVYFLVGFGAVVAIVGGLLYVKSRNPGKRLIDVLRGK